MPVDDLRVIERELEGRSAILEHLDVARFTSAVATPDGKGSCVLLSVLPIDLVDAQNPLMR
jgi:hypothetical protein